MRKIWTPEKLRQVKTYRRDGKTIAEIAALIGKSHAAVDRAIIYHRIGKLTPKIRRRINLANTRKMRRKWQADLLNQIKMYRDGGKTAAEIAEIMGETLEAIRGAIKKYRLGNLTHDERIIRATANAQEVWRERFEKSHWSIISKKDTEAMGRLFAAYVAREPSEKSGRHFSDIILSHPSKEVVAGFRDALKEVLGRKNISIRRQYVFGKKKWVVVAYSRPLAEYLHNHYWTVTGILQRPSRLRSRDFWRGYIQTLFDFWGDAGRVKNGRIRRGAVYLLLPRYLKNAGSAMYHDAMHYLKFKNRKGLLRFKRELKSPSNRALMKSNKMARREWRRFKKIWYVEFLREILQDFGLSVTKVRFRMGWRRQRAYLSIMPDLPTVWRFATEIGFRHKAKAARLAAMLRHIIKRDKAALKTLSARSGFQRRYLQKGAREFKKLLREIGADNGK